MEIIRHFKWVLERNGRTDGQKRSSYHIRQLIFSYIKGERLRKKQFCWKSSPPRYEFMELFSIAGFLDGYVRICQRICRFLFRVNQPFLFLTRFLWPYFLICDSTFFTYVRDTIFQKPFSKDKSGAVFLRLTWFFKLWPVFFSKWPDFCLLWNSFFLFKCV